MAMNGRRMASVVLGADQIRLMSCQMGPDRPQSIGRLRRRLVPRPHAMRAYRRPDRRFALHLTRIGGHLILAGSRRKESRHGTSIEVPG
jgi:hypothetical protein